MNRRAFLTTAGTASLAIPAMSRALETVPQDTPRPDPVKGFEPYLDIKLAGLSWNVEQLYRRAGRPILAVLKDNAYGHGIIGVARHFETLTQVYGYAVVKIQEAIDIKTSGAKNLVVLLGPTTDEELEYVVAHDIIPSIYHDRGALLARLSAKYHKNIHVHFYVDTGMGRVGVPYYEALAVAEALAKHPEIIFDGVLTKLAEEDDFDTEQVRRLDELHRQALQKGIRLGLRHAGSSGAIFHVPTAYMDMVRPGISLYGCYPDDRSEQSREIPLKSTFDFKTRVMYVKNPAPGIRSSMAGNISLRSRHGLPHFPSGIRTDGRDRRPTAVRWALPANCIR